MFQIPVAVLDTVIDDEDWIFSDAFFCSGYLFSIGISTEEEKGKTKFAVGIIFDGPALDIVPGVHVDKEGTSGVVVSYDEFVISTTRMVPAARDLISGSFEEVDIISYTPCLAYPGNNVTFEYFPTIGPLGSKSSKSSLSQLLADAGYIKDEHLHLTVKISLRKGYAGRGY